MHNEKTLNQMIPVNTKVKEVKYNREYIVKGYVRTKTTKNSDWTVVNIILSPLDNPHIQYAHPSDWFFDTFTF